jgi:hypothetical protein
MSTASSQQHTSTAPSGRGRGRPAPGRQIASSGWTPRPGDNDLVPAHRVDQRDCILAQAGGFVVHRFSLAAFSQNAVNYSNLESLRSGLLPPLCGRIITVMVGRESETRDRRWLGSSVAPAREAIGMQALAGRLRSAGVRGWLCVISPRHVNTQSSAKQDGRSGALRITIERTAERCYVHTSPESLGSWGLRL